MVRDIRVVIVEDDFYARHWMELLLRRDWRTRVVGEADGPAALSKALEAIHQHQEQVDLLLIDTDIPHDDAWLDQTLRSLERHNAETRVLFTGVAPNPKVIRYRARHNFAGYILKDEIRYSLSWAVTLAAEQHIVITPGVCDLFEKTNPLPGGTLILDGRSKIPAFSDSDDKRSRMVFIFSMERNEFADEEGISEDFSFGVVSALYEKIGLNDVLTGAIKPEEYFGDNPIVLAHVRRAIETIREAETRAGQKSTKTRGANGEENQDIKKMARVKEKESLAFHLLTLPTIDRIPL